MLQEIRAGRGLGRRHEQGGSGGVLPSAFVSWGVMLGGNIP